MLYQKLQQNCISWFIRLHKSISKPQCVKLSNKVNTNSKTNANISDITKIYNFLNENNLEVFVQSIKKRVQFTKFLKTNRLDLIDPWTAKTLSSMISKDLLEKESTVIQCNPGMGLLTQELLNDGVSFLHLYEYQSLFLKENTPLSKLYSTYSTQMNFKTKNFIKIWMPLLKNKYCENNILKEYFNDIELHELGEKPVNIITGVVNRDFIALLIINFYEQTDLFKYMDLTFYMIVHPVIWWRLAYTFTNIQYYTRFSVFLHLFFDVKHLGTLPRGAFVPWTKEMLEKNLNESSNHLIVVKLTLKKEYDSLILKEDLISFALFLKFCMRSKTIFVIQELEKLVPDCGLRLIEMNMNILTTFKELTPEDLLNLFKNFKSWPEYDISLFFPSHRDELTE